MWHKSLKSNPFKKMPLKRLLVIFSKSFAKSFNFCCLYHYVTFEINKITLLHYLQIHINVSLFKVATSSGEASLVLLGTLTTRATLTFLEKRTRFFFPGVSAHRYVPSADISLSLLPTALSAIAWGSHDPSKLSSVITNLSIGVLEHTGCGEACPLILRMGLGVSTGSESVWIWFATGKRLLFWEVPTWLLFSSNIDDLQNQIRYYHLLHTDSSSWLVNFLVVMDWNGLLPLLLTNVNVKSLIIILYWYPLYNHVLVRGTSTGTGIVSKSTIWYRFIPLRYF